MTISPSSTKAPPLERRTSALKSDIVEIWSQVQARVIQLAGGDSSKIQGNLDINGVLACLDQAHQEPEKESPIREAFNKTLQFIDTVGGIVAGGASEVFGPSELCFNAISFVIQAWQGYQGVFESLAGLLERCGQYLGRLEYYIRGGLDAKLSKVACQHLQLFVEICDRTIKLRQSKRRKLMVFTKILFLNDNDIQDLLEKMDSLVDEEGRLVTAQTFSFASEAAISTRENLAISRAVNSKIDLLIANRSDQLKESDTKRRKERILETLAFDENKLDQEKNEPDPYWQKTYYNYRKYVVPGTGEWILSEPEFKTWEKGLEDSPPILALEGTEGSGKSYLASTIIRRLRNRSSGDESDSRGLLAFYFVEGDSKEELKRTNHLDVISKSLIWQFVQADASYLKSVANICERIGDIDPHEIPSKLLFGNQDLGRTIDATFFIVIDGLSDIIGDALVKFLQSATTVAAEHRKIRILLTGHTRAVEQLSSHKDIAFKTISIKEKNRSDIEIYTQSRMDRIEALKDTSRFGVPELRKKISDNLCEKTAGDYFRVNTILKHISSLDYVNDIDQVLENSGKERSQQIEGEIEMLNNTKSPKEIAEINEIILWILYGREWLKPPQVAAIIYTKTGELSLLTLETKLQIKYSLFEVDSDGDVDFRSYEIAELIPERGKALSEQTDLDSKRILPEEITIIRHFLKTVCPPTLYDKFDFETVFEQKLRHTGGYICQEDKDTAEVKIAVTCLRILTEKSDRRREVLRPYAVNYFIQHLSSVDLSLVDREWKSAVGPLLMKLFIDEAATDALIWTENHEYAPNFAWVARTSWTDGDDGVKQVLRWLRDTAVISSVSDGGDKDWISKLTSNSKPERELLQILSKRMAVHWLREQTPQTLVGYAFSFLLNSMKKIIDIGPDEDEDELGSSDDPTVEDIFEVEQWSRSLLNCKVDSLWEVQVAIILNSFYFDAEAEKRCRHALELDSTNWRASYYLSSVVTSNLEAIEILEVVTHDLGTNDEWMQEHSHKMAFAEMLFDLGQRYWEAEQYENAIDSYTRSVKANYTGFKRALMIIEKYYDRRLWQDIVALLETIQNASDNEPHLGKMLVELASQESFHRIILQTAMETNRFEFLERVYNEAIQMSSESEDYTSLYYIRYQYADAIFQQGDGEEKAIQLWEVALNEDLPHSFLDTEYILPSLTVKLAPIYLRKARAAERNSEVAQDYLQRISSIHPDEASESNVILPAKLYLARYYQVMGDEIKAKLIVRSLVKVALEILSDDDSDNDYLAYWRLLLVFLPLNDDKNATAAVSMAALASQSSFTRPGDSSAPPLEEAKKDDKKDDKKEEGIKEKKDSAGKLLQGDRAGLVTVIESGGTETTDSEFINADDGPESQVFAVCDGGCGFYWETASEMWWCRDCINLTFDKVCFEKLQNGNLPLKVCDKKHEFLAVPKWDDAEIKDTPKGFVPYGGKAISLEEWKREIMKKYVNFEVPDQREEKMAERKKGGT